jgi:hypothetical protein
MLQYSPVFKRDLVLKVMNRPGEKQIGEVASEYGVSRATMFRWLKEYMLDPEGAEVRAARPQDWSVSAKLKALLETKDLSEYDLGVYLRANGLYHCHLDQWKEEVLGVMAKSKKHNKKADIEETLLKQKIKDLQKELKRKDKALREATALLVLKKKAQKVWGIEDEADEHLSMKEKELLDLLKKPGKKAQD